MALISINPDDVKLGMYIHDLKGSWVDHPFWTTEFELTQPSDLLKLQKSKVSKVVVDTEKGSYNHSLNTTGTDSKAVKSYSNSGKEPENVVEKSGVSRYPWESVKRIPLDAELETAAKIIASSKKAVTQMFADIRMGKAINKDAAVPLIESISASIHRNESALISLVRIKTSDDYTYMHSVAVCALMVALSKQLGLSGEDLLRAGTAGLFHDLGKANIPVSILTKPGPLTPDEFDVMKSHPKHGHDLLQSSGMVDSVVLDVCLHHHEKLDGTGYPEGLKSEQISMFAKMGAICDIYDAVTSTRPYKAGWEPATSLQRMAKWEGHLDPVIFRAFVKSVGIYPVGTKVRLKSGKAAIVIDQSEKSLTAPIVKVFYSLKHDKRIPVETLDLSKAAILDEIVEPLDPSILRLKGLNVDNLWME